VEYSNIFITNFRAVDWVIVAIYLLGSLLIGLSVRRYITSLADYVVAGRGLRLYLALATMTGTEIGLVTLMYNAQEGFEKGLSAYVIGVCWGLGLLIVGLTGFIVRPLRAAEIMTIAEFYERRFSVRVRIIGGLIMALAGILNMGLFLQADARFLTSVFGLGPGLGLKLVMTAMLVMVLIYTSLGGMISVVITDYMQFVLLGAAMVLATLLALHTTGWDTMVRLSLAERGLAGLNPVAPGGYGWSYILWMIYMGVAAGSLWATATARALSARSPKVAQQLYLWSSITFLSRVILPVTWGVAALAFVASRPELRAIFLTPGPHKLSTQYAMPLYMARLLPSGWLGLMTAGMMAASMSTYSSYFLQWAAIITQDVIGPLYRVSPQGRQAAALIVGVAGGSLLAAIIYGLLRLAGQPGWADFLVATLGGTAFAAWAGLRIPRLLEGLDLPERARILFTRVTVLLIGAYLLVWGLWYEAPSTLWTYMAITGTVYLSGAFVCVVFGLYWRRAAERGALAALLVGLLAVAGLLPWKKWGVPWMTETNIAVVTILLAALAMITLSLPRSKPLAVSGPPSTEEVS
jgi:SSS family solute:Na+ symporter